jgi:hypothetical protein
MKKVVVAIVFAFSACGVGTEGAEAEGTVVSESRGQRSDALTNDLPFGLCSLTCGDGPTIPPEGQTCTLVSDKCEYGIRTCVWDCKPTAPKAPTRYNPVPKYPTAPVLTR